MQRHARHADWLQSSDIGSMTRARGYELGLHGATSGIFSRAGGWAYALAQQRYDIVLSDRGWKGSLRRCYCQMPSRDGLPIRDTGRAASGSCMVRPNPTGECHLRASWSSTGLPQIPVAMMCVRWSAGRPSWGDSGTPDRVGRLACYAGVHGVPAHCTACNWAQTQLSPVPR